MSHANLSSIQRSDLYCPLSWSLDIWRKMKFHLHASSQEPTSGITCQGRKQAERRDHTSRSPAPGPSLTPGRGPWVLWPQILGLWRASDPGFLLQPGNRILALPSHAYYRLLHQGKGKEPALKGLCEILVSRREGGHLSLLRLPPSAHTYLALTSS